MVDYKQIPNVVAYAAGLVEAGAAVVTGVKFARVLAREAQAGETVTSWAVDAQGGAVREKEAQAAEGDWVLTKADEDGRPVTDEHGHLNRWIVDGDTFARKYQPAGEAAGLYRPKGGPQQFVRLTEAVTLRQWGSEMNIDCGGWLNITDASDIYGISARDFADTYRIV